MTGLKIHFSDLSRKNEYREREKRKETEREHLFFCVNKPLKRNVNTMNEFHSLNEFLKKGIGKRKKEKERKMKE